MVKSLKTRTLLMFCVLGVAFLSCEEDPKETCLFDEICTDVEEVTYCCTDDVCVYKYNGRDYTEDQLNDLIEDLGCGVAMDYKSTNNVEDIELLKSRLHALRDKVHDTHFAN